MKDEFLAWKYLFVLTVVFVLFKYVNKYFSRRWRIEYTALLFLLSLSQLLCTAVNLQVHYAARVTESSAKTQYITLKICNPENFEGGGAKSVFFPCVLFSQLNKIICKQLTIRFLFCINIGRVPCVSFVYCVILWSKTHLAYVGWR